MNLTKVYPKRNKWIHKGENGYVLAIAGSKKYTGSAIFNTFSALKSGADLAVALGPKRAMDVAACFSPDIITFPLEGDFLRKKHFSYIMRIINSKKFNSLIIGSGLGRDEQTLFVVRQIIKETNLPMVIDADAIWAVAENKEIIYGKRAILTPNSREFEILTNEKINPDLRERKIKVKEWAKKLNCSIILKGYIDVISDGEKIALNKTGSPLMTKGGFGDTLAGILGAILAKDISPFESAQIAAFINGRAGQLAAVTYGQSIVASDIFKFIGKVIE